MLDIRESIIRSKGKSARTLLATHEQQLLEELRDMCYKDLANFVLEAALEIGNKDLVNRASRVILCSGGYTDACRRVALIHNTDPDLERTRDEVRRALAGVQV